MKKLLCFVLVPLALLSCLTACYFTKNASGALAGEAESVSKAEEMMTALAENRVSNAKALMHPEVAEDSDAAIAQMSDYLAGRKTRSLELVNININTSTGPSGKVRQENAAYRVTLTDGTVIYSSVIYLSNHTGTGFASFHLVLGAI